MAPWSNASGMEPSDRDLMARLVAGDRDALDPLMERHHRRLYRIALGYLRDPDLAKDVVQETFVKAFQNASRWDTRAEVAPWLARIAVNQSIDQYRRVRRRRTAEEPLAEGDHSETLTVGDASPDALVRGREIGERIQTALAVLPERQRAVFVLRHCEEMTLEEIAESLQMNLGTVKSALHRAVRRLRETLVGVRA
jgi:RNA polymerase sigma-70 factor (ECF subfamily)